MKDEGGKLLVDAVIEALAKIDEMPQELLTADEGSKFNARQIAAFIVVLCREGYSPEQVVQASLALALLAAKEIGQEIVNMAAGRMTGL